MGDTYRLGPRRGLQDREGKPWTTEADALLTEGKAWIAINPQSRVVR